MQACSRGQAAGTAAGQLTTAGALAELTSAQCADSLLAPELTIFFNGLLRDAIRIRRDTRPPTADHHRPPHDGNSSTVGLQLKVPLTQSTELKFGLLLLHNLSP